MNRIPDSPSMRSAHDAIGAYRRNDVCGNSLWSLLRVARSEEIDHAKNVRQE